MESTKDAPLEASFTVAEIASVLRKRPQFVRQEIHSGRLKAYRIGAELRLFRSDLESYLEAHQSAGPDPRRRPKSHRGTPRTAEG